MAMLQIKAGDWERIFGQKVPEKADNTRQIHISDVRTFLSCRRQWNYSSPLRMGFEAVLPNMNLWMGRAVHEGLDFWYKHGGPRATLDFYDGWCAKEIDKRGNVGPKFEELMQETRDLGWAMLRHYIMFSRMNDKFEVLSTEGTMAVRLPYIDNTAVVSRLDLVGRDKYGKLFIMDHKTTARVPRHKDVLNDNQAITYAYILMHQPIANGDVPYFMFNWLWKKEPHLPRTLQNGKLSRAKLTQTTFEAYGQAIREAGQSWDQYTDVLMELRSNPNRYFQRHQINYTKRALQNHARDLSLIASEMLSPMPSIYPAPDRFKCTWCDFRDACQLETAGASPKGLLQANFRKRGVEWR